MCGIGAAATRTKAIVPFQRPMCVPSFPRTMENLKKQREVKMNSLPTTPLSKREQLQREAQLHLSQINSWWKETGHCTNFIVATNPKHFKSEVLSAKDQLVVVDYISPSCYACKSMFSKVKQLADNNPEVKFITVNVDEMPELANGMQVKVLPFFQLWRDGEMVAGLSANLKTVDVLRAELSSHKDCTVPQCASN